MGLLCAQLNQQQDDQGNQTATLGAVTRNKKKKLWDRVKGPLSRQEGSQRTSKVDKKVV